jgi:hypothetical protein
MVINLDKNEDEMFNKKEYEQAIQPILDSNESP